MTYEIIFSCNINGEACDCLCTVPTKSGCYCTGCRKESAEQRIKELKDIGINAWMVMAENPWYLDSSWD